MKKLLSYIIGISILLLPSCAKEDLRENGGSVAEGESWVLLDFAAQRNREVETKATVSPTNESQIYNFYFFVFDRNGAKVTGQYFDSQNQKVSRAAVESSQNNCWYVGNATTDDGTTGGTVRIKTTNGENLKFYMIANLDADMVRISSDLLAHNIQNEGDLLGFNVYMNQRIVNRNGYFQMTGKMDGITIGKDSGSGSSVTILSSVMSLRRLDAKIRFIFKTGSRPDENGQVIKSFEALQWKVVNVPRTAYLYGYDARNISSPNGNDFVSVSPDIPPSEYSEYAKEFFDTDFVNFEDFPSTGQSEFSFYMLENRQKPKKTPGTYQDRSRSIKSVDGKNESCNVSYVLNGVPYERSMREFEYANDFSTYVVVTGRVDMDLVNDKAGQVLGGDVQYIIHLGDWNAEIDNSDGNRGDGNDSYSGFDNFNTERNTSYTYTVTVNGVNSIRVEVETSQGGKPSDVVENQPGSSGAITIAKEEIMLCDCHYISKTINFRLASFFEGGVYDRDHCIIDRLTWSVKTPFGEGEPYKKDGLDITDGLDYRWVHFRLNKKDADGNFMNARRKYCARTFETSGTLRSASDNKEGDGTPGLAGYHNDGTMYITELVDYIRTQVNRYLESRDASEFDHRDSPKDAKLTFTVFVDEYYYERNPLTNDKDATLWKQFVNQDDRKLHILCSSDISLDEESRTTGAVITIQQKAIQSIYNTDPSYTALSTAWGVENEDEFEGLSTYWSSTESVNRYNNRNDNGLYNTCKEWELSSGAGNGFNTGVKWDTFMDWEVDNDTPQFNSDHSYLRYSCMNRNRDNNGDGVIDRSEVRWYLASINQLIGMVVGKGLLSSKTQLYNRSPEQQKSENEFDWNQHVISSTQYGYNSNDPTMVWAEEGLSTSQTNINWQHIKKATVRCVRNLGFINGNSDETYPIDKMPEDYIQMEREDNGNYVFTTTHLNSQALRYYTSRELTYGDELTIENRLYKKFEVYGSTSGFAGMYFEDYNRRVTESVAAGNGNPYCPEGYRTPNQTEICLMKYYMPGNLRSVVSRTKWSFGADGSNRKESAGNRYGSIVNSQNITLSHETVTGVRCVRDIRVN